VLGTPSQEDQKYIGNENALKYIKNLPKRTRQPWDKLFPNFKPSTYDILNRMLTFNPDKRYTVEECLGIINLMQLIHILTVYILLKRSLLPIRFSTGPGIISNRRRNYYKQWYTNRAFTSTQISLCKSIRVNILPILSSIRISLSITIDHQKHLFIRVLKIECANK
jgi:serine/threonine protein kinase